MNLTIEIPDDHAARYQKMAQSRGLTVERWMLEVADNAATPAPSEQAIVKPQQTMSEFMQEIWGDLPDDARAKLPRDGASQIDHYVYGLPKREL